MGVSEDVKLRRFKLWNIFSGTLGKKSHSLENVPVIEENQEAAGLPSLDEMKWYVPFMSRLS